MSEQGHRRPLIIVATGIAAAVVSYIAYRAYLNTLNPTATPSLHRSNAVRRSRRRWRRGFAPRDIDQDPIVTALANLRTRTEEGRPYGQYNNQLLLTSDVEQTETEVFDLLPTTLNTIYTTLSHVRPMTDLERDKLRFHITSLFVQNFLVEEFPPGWIIGDDVETLVQELSSAYSMDGDCIRMMVTYFDHGKPLLSQNWDVREGPVPISPENVAQSHGSVEQASTQQAIEALTGPSHGGGSDITDDDDEDDDNNNDEDDNESDPGGSQNMLDLLYHIAGEQAKREGFIHRDVVCNSCHQKPIQGIRYHCANCFDYDLCEDCEAQQVHNKNHVFYKVRIPVPPRGRIKQVTPVWYPGQPNAFPGTMPRNLQRRLVEKVGMDQTEMEASYEQFKCVAGEQIPIEDDPASLGMAISRPNFDAFFTPTSLDRPPLPSLIYDRIFAFYDLNNDGVITFDEYIIGISTLMDKSRGARLKRMFMGYDLDADGYIDRKDFLRMFRAFYALTKEHNKEDDLLRDDLDEDIRDVVLGSQPISAAFSGSWFVGHVSRTGQDKELDVHGDLVVLHGGDSVLRNDTDMTGDRVRAIGNAAVRDQVRTHPFTSFRQQPELDEELLYLPYETVRREAPTVSIVDEVVDEDGIGTDPALHIYGWPPRQTPDVDDVVRALGVEIPLDDVTDPVDRSRIIHAQLSRLDEESDKTLDSQRRAAVNELWRRRQFYLDEEEGLTKPPGYKEPDSSDDDDDATSIDDPPGAPQPVSTNSRRQSLRSRSSSKVRFEDDAIDTDHETRSNTSSRSIPVNERWGGFELSAPERDVGREILYQAVQQGFNELLDPLFKAKEDEAMEVLASRMDRIKWAKELDQYEAARKQKSRESAEARKQADLQQMQATLSAGGSGDARNGKVEGPRARPSTPASEHDETDHIQLMFGGSRGKNQDSPATSRLGLDDKHVMTETSPDPTLPQNKPNDPACVVHHSADKPSTDNTRPSDLPPSDNKLETWRQHRKIDEQARKRGGYGKLSYFEFCRIMIQEASRDEVGNARGVSTIGGLAERRETSPALGARANEQGDAGDHDHHHGNDNNGNNDDDDDDQTDEQKWSSTGDFGRMSFCGAWLEMALF